MADTERRAEKQAGIERRRFDLRRRESLRQQALGFGTRKTGIEANADAIIPSLQALPQPWSTRA